MNIYPRDHPALPGPAIRGINSAQQKHLITKKRDDGFTKFAFYRMLRFYGYWNADDIPYKDYATLLTAEAAPWLSNEPVRDGVIEERPWHMDLNKARYGLARSLVYATHAEVLDLTGNCIFHNDSDLFINEIRFRLSLYTRIAIAQEYLS